MICDNCQKVIPPGAFRTRRTQWSDRASQKRAQATLGRTRVFDASEAASDETLCETCLPKTAPVTRHTP